MALTKTQISKLYVAIFGRASEGEGNLYWQQQNGDISTIANEMLNTQAAKDYFGATLNDNQEFIKFIYKNSLNKTYEQDPDGIKFWTDVLNSGVSKGEIVKMMIEAIDSYAPGGVNYNPTDIATVNAYNQFANRVEISDYTADNILITPTNFSTSMSFNEDLLVTYDSNTLQSAKQNIGNNLEFHNFPNNGLYVYSDGLFTNNSHLDVVVKDLGMKVNGNLNFEGQNIVFQMNGTIEKGISVTSNMGNDFMPGFDFPDQVISSHESIDLNNFLPDQEFISIPGISGQMYMEVSMITTIGVFIDETTVYF